MFWQADHHFLYSGISIWFTWTTLARNIQNIVLFFIKNGWSCIGLWRRFTCFSVLPSIKFSIESQGNNILIKLTQVLFYWLLTCIYYSMLDCPFSIMCCRVNKQFKQNISFLFNTQYEAMFSINRARINIKLCCIGNKLRCWNKLLIILYVFSGFRYVWKFGWNSSFIITIRLHV